MRVASAYANRLLTKFAQYDDKERHTSRYDMDDIRSRFDIPLHARSFSNTISYFTIYLDLVQDICYAAKEFPNHSGLQLALDRVDWSMLRAVRDQNSHLETMFSANCYDVDFNYHRNERADVSPQASSSSSQRGLSPPLYVIDTSGSRQDPRTPSPEMEVLSPSYSCSDYSVDEDSLPALSDLGPPADASPHGYSPITSSAFASRAPTPSPPSPTPINPAPAPFASLPTLDYHGSFNHATLTPILNINGLPICAQGTDDINQTSDIDEEKRGLERENDSKCTKLRRDHELTLLAYVKASLHDYSSRPSTPIQDDEQSPDVEDSQDKKFVPVSSSAFYNAHAASSSDNEDNDVKPPYGCLSPIRRETSPELQPSSNVGYFSEKRFQLFFQNALESTPPRIAGHRYWSLGQDERKRRASPTTEMEELMRRRVRHE